MSGGDFETHPLGTGRQLNLVSQQADRIEALEGAISTALADDDVSEKTRQVLSNVLSADSQEAR